MKKVMITAVCTDKGMEDSMGFSAELDEASFINTRRKLDINGFADGYATWNGLYYSICLFEWAGEDDMAGIAWNDCDTMKANLLNRRIEKEQKFTVFSAHGEFTYIITAVDMKCGS